LHFLKDFNKQEEIRKPTPQKLEKIRDDSEPLENFDEYLFNDVNPLEYLKFGAKNGFSRFITLKGETQWRECEILSFNPEKKKYLIQFFNTEIKKEVRNYKI